MEYLIATIIGIFVGSWFTWGMASWYYRDWINRLMAAIDIKTNYIWETTEGKDSELMRLREQHAIMLEMLQHISPIGELQWYYNHCKKEHDPRNDHGKTMFEFKTMFCDKKQCERRM